MSSAPSSPKKNINKANILNYSMTKKSISKEKEQIDPNNIEINIENPEPMKNKKKSVKKNSNNKRDSNNDNISILSKSKKRKKNENTNKKSVKISEKVDVIEVESFKQYNCDMSENVAKKNSKYKCCCII